jgi:hypothetical protein
LLFEKTVAAAAADDDDGGVGSDSTVARFRKSWGKAGFT